MAKLKSIKYRKVAASVFATQKAFLIVGRDRDGPFEVWLCLLAKLYSYIDWNEATIESSLLDTLWKGSLPGTLSQDIGPTHVWQHIAML